MQELWQNSFKFFDSFKPRSSFGGWNEVAAKEAIFTGLDWRKSRFLTRSYNSEFESKIAKKL